MGTRENKASGCATKSCPDGRSWQAARHFGNGNISLLWTSLLILLLILLTARAGLAGKLQRREADAITRNLRSFQPELLYHPSQILSSGVTVMQLSSQMENAWMYRLGKYRIDTEILQFAIRGHYGVGHGLELAMEIPLRYYSGGIMDPVIEGFHSVFGFSNGHRDDYPQDDFAFEVLHHDRTGDTAFPMNKKRGWGLVRPAAAISHIWTGSQSSISISSTLLARFPGSSGEEILIYRSDDLGLSLGIGMKRGGWKITAMPSISWQHQKEVAGIALNQWQYGGSVSAERYRPGSNHAFIFRILMQSGIARSFSQLATFRFQTTASYNRRISSTALVEIGLSENVFHHDNSPDIGLHLSFIKTLSP